MFYCLCRRITSQPNGIRRTDTKLLGQRVKCSVRWWSSNYLALIELNRDQVIQNFLVITKDDCFVSYIWFLVQKVTRTPILKVLRH